MEMFTIAAPTIATMATYTAMQFADGLMVSRIQPASPVYVAAQGNGGMWTWVAISFVIGVIGVINTYVAQFLGKGEPRKGSAYGWVGIWLPIIFWVLLLPYAFFLPVLFERVMGHTGELLRLETQYAQISLYGSIFTMIARGVGQFFFGLHRAKVPMLAALIAVGGNIFANWVLIYGHLGAPALGMAGAAIGTIIGSAVEMTVLLVVFLGPAYARSHGTRSAWRFRLGPMLDVLRLGWPAGAMIVNEMICWGYLMTNLLPAGGRAAGQSGELHNSVGWIALRYMHIAFMPAVGMSIALTAIVGRCMGMGRPDLAARRAWLGLGVTVGYMGLCALAMVLLRGPAVRLFIDQGTDPEIAAQMVALGSRVMVIAAVFQIFDALGIALTGALRGAGDTHWPGLVSVALSWVFLILGGNLMIRFWPELGSIGPWLAASGYIISVGLALFVRFLRGKWRSMSVLREHGGGPEMGIPPDLVAGVSPGSP